MVVLCDLLWGGVYWGEAGVFLPPQKLRAVKECVLHWQYGKLWRMHILTRNIKSLHAVL